MGLAEVGAERGAKSLRSRFENMAKAGEEDARRHAEEERRKREEKDRREKEEAKKAEEVGEGAWKSSPRCPSCGFTLFLAKAFLSCGINALKRRLTS